MEVWIQFFEFVFKAIVVTSCVIVAGFKIVRYAVDYAFRAKQGYMNTMIDKATQIGANIDVGIQ